MTEINKEIEKMAKTISELLSSDRILYVNKTYDDIGTQLATSLHNAHYRPEAEVRAEAVKEFAEKVKTHIVGTITGYEQFIQAEKELNGIDTNTYTTIKSNIEVYQRLINTIRNLAAQFGKEE